MPAEATGFRPRLGICLNYLCATSAAADALPAVSAFLESLLEYDSGHSDGTSWFSGTIYLLLPASAEVTTRLHQAIDGNEVLRRFRTVELEASGGDIKSMLESLAARNRGSEAADAEQETGIFHFWGDSAFLNTAANREILSLHLKYLSDYVFAEGYPGGVCGEILSDDIIPSVAGSGEGVPVARNGLFEAVKPNINAYEVETEVSPADLRMLRLQLFHDVQRNRMICSRLGTLLDHATGREELCDIIAANQQAYRSLPAFFALQLSAGCPQSCGYCPYPRMNPAHLGDRRVLAPEDFRNILDKITRFVEDPVISLSAWGESALHPDFPALLAEAAGNSGARYLIETSGVGWSEESRSALAAFAPGQINVIVSMDAVDPVLYRELRGNGFEEASAFIEQTFAILGNHLYVQAVRMNENEEHLGDFHRHWKERGIPFIIQKYSSHSGLLTDRQIADLSPIRRHACWHLKRDLVIETDGTVYSCLSHSANKDFSLGNLLTDDIDKIWARGEALYASHLDESLPDICMKCDEWYTFNF
jgi:spiro-SPASM protein